MFRIGLTGGIAAGKSVALARFAELGAVVIDYDALARDAVAPGSVGLDEVVEVFGTDVLTADGTLDRPALARIVFADDAARERLNAVVHPEVRRLAAEREAELSHQAEREERASHRSPSHLRRISRTDPRPVVARS